MSRLPLLYYCDHYDIPLPAGHKFPMEKYRLTRNRLEESGRFRFAPGPRAREADLLRVHDPEYVRAFLASELSDAALRRIGFPRTPELLLRTLSSVGATVEATQVALREGWSGVLAGGTHHAYRDFGSGFCVLNDMAVAAAALLEQEQAQRIAIVDLDVHQGDGTAAIFTAEPRVFTFSAHGRHNFPFRKMVSRLDLEFDNGTGDAEYLAQLAPALEAVKQFEPDFVFYQAGVDALATDRLGKLGLSPEGLRARDRMVLEWVRTAKLPLVITLGGGYSDPIEHTVAASSATYLAAAEILG